MKKRIVILFLLSFQFQSFCQDHFTAKVPCSDSLLITIKGSYTKIDDYINSSISTVLPKAQQSETMKRMDAMHKLLLEAYPQPIGMDGKWNRNLETGLFSPDVTGLTGTSVCSYYYHCVFGSNTCYQDRPMDVSIYADVYNVLQVYANEIGKLMSLIHLDTMSINGRKVFMLNPLLGSWNGYDLYGGVPGDNFRCVVLSRKGESPFIPVTRQQYIAYSLNYLDRFFDEQIKFAKQMAPQNGQETVNTMIELKRKVIGQYEVEFEKSKAANLLDAPAEVNMMFEVNEGVPIFYSGAEGGKMLVTENPAYFRKDLPKYVPQFMVLYWEWVGNFPMYGGAQGEYYKKMIEENFPIEKLQEMIDK